MSVRNILDGTIKVEGSGMETEIPEELTLTSLRATGDVIGATLNATDKLVVGTSRGNTTITPAEITTSNLTVRGNQVLNMQYFKDKITVSGVKADGTTSVSFEISPKRWMYNIYPELHMLVTTFSITTEPLSQLTIPTGLTCGEQTSWWGKTLLKADDQFLDCVTVISSSDGKLVIKIDIPTASSYAGLEIRLATTFY